MNKHFPDILRRAMAGPQVKQVFLLDYEGDGSCDNCGGSGEISFFIATMGPFAEPAAGKFISKFHDGKWWCAPSGDLHFGTVSAPCPDCKDRPNRKRPIYVPMPDYVRVAHEAAMARLRIK